MNAADRLDALDLARRLAVDAGDVVRDPSRLRAAEWKPDATPVTEIDRAIQAGIVHSLHLRFPDHAIVAEEGLPPALRRSIPDSRDARHCWVIDPLDGTRNLVIGFPCFATSIALLDEGNPILGAVVEHNLNAVFAASVGAGATWNNHPIRVSEARPTDDLLLAVPSSKDPLTERIVHRWLATPRVNLRNVGSAAMHLAWVACGALHGAFCKQCKIWDIAAGMVLVMEAGGRMTAPDGRPLAPFKLDFDADAAPDIPSLAASSTLHSHLLATIAD